ncbi:molecular chaperone [Bordetella sp. BOR01]|uniref:fimbrial biogenesis chaperone n=1 Tax=Bordetella sp. BOR01 TaxID=2854779 RepID=UPI001C468999|nr:fimbria/pilus periplasmic chaperone [Bordetella sp. BOR01]MBV7483488.1 molecular chaperone [Bordetella sp. BOR01]
MKNLLQHLFLTATMASTLAGGAAQAAIQLSSTRVIMNEDQRHVSVFAKNLSTDPYVVQAWIDGVAEEMDTPFFVTPPLSRFDGNAERRLSITRVGQGLPDDRESYYWINVLEIPQKKNPGENNLALAMHTRIKLFYRPAAIQKLPRGPELLKWMLVRDGKTCRLAIENASAFTVNFARIDIAGEGAGFGRAVVGTPLATTHIALRECPAATDLMATPHVVNDYGVSEAWPAVPVSPAASSAQ